MKLHLHQIAFICLASILPACDSQEKPVSDSRSPQSTPVPVDVVTSATPSVVARPSNMPEDCYFNKPGDVTIVTDGTDFRLRLTGGNIGSEVFSTKQEAIDYIYKMKRIMNPGEGKDYQVAP